MRHTVRPRGGPEFELYDVAKDPLNQTDLAAHHPDDIQAYVTIKDPVCDVIMSAAEEWAAATGWQP